jgi:hypothetical protein
MTSSKNLWLPLAALALITTAAYADIHVTVYNSDLGVIRETRPLEFMKGSGIVSFVDVPTAIDATSVGFELVDKSKSVAILEQNYAYDLVSPEKIYSKYIDKDIDLFNKEGQLFSGTLLSFSGGSLVLKDKSGKIQIIRLEQIVNVNFPELPEGLITRPTLFWRYNSNFSGKTDANVSYQTRGMGWTAEYVGILSEDEKTLGLNGWASITNSSGATYKDAVLKLVAGDINRAGYARGMARPETFDKAMMVAEAPGFEEKAFFEYHLYTLPRPATLANNEIKQISLFDPSSGLVDKEYNYYPDQNDKDIRVMLKFKNSRETGLGMPLPAGRVRIFKVDTDKGMILLGEDRISHTPKDEEVKLTIGNAFDIKAEFKVTDYNQISNRIDEQTFEIKLRNHKKQDVTINVEKKLYGDWTILESSHKYEKTDASTVKFAVPVAADGTAVVTVRVRTTR